MLKEKERRRGGYTKEGGNERLRNVRGGREKRKDRERKGGGGTAAEGVDPSTTFQLGQNGTFTLMAQPR